MSASLPSPGRTGSDAAPAPGAAVCDSFVFEATQRCNHCCLHCYNVWHSGRAYPAGELGTADTLEMLGRMLADSGARLVSLSGGEPLLRDDLDEILGFLHARGVAANLITNGSFLEGARLARLLPDRISVFELPLLSADPSIHDRMSGVEGAFDRAMQAMAELKAARQRVVGVFVATRLNLPTWGETAELAVALGLDGIMLNRFNPGGRGLQNLRLLQASPAEVTAALDVAEEISRQYDVPINCSIAMPPCLFDTARYQRVGFGFCAAGTQRAYYALDPLGNVRPCNHSPRILGNILKESFRLIAAGEAMRDFRRARPAFCRGCRFEEECQGGCKAAAEAACGSPWAADPFLSTHLNIARKQAAPAGQG